MRSTHHKYLSEAKVKQRRYATVPTACGIETLTCSVLSHLVVYRCNNTYRLRYAPKGARQQRSKATMRSAHLKYLSKAKVKRRWWSNSTYRLRYWNGIPYVSQNHSWWWLQQHLPFTVCAAKCEAAEERSDDEAHTLQVPERREGKTKVMRK